MPFMMFSGQLMKLKPVRTFLSLESEASWPIPFRQTYRMLQNKSSYYIIMIYILECSFIISGSESSGVLRQIARPSISFSMKFYSCLDSVATFITSVWDIVMSTFKYTVVAQIKACSSSLICCIRSFITLLKLSHSSYLISSRLLGKLSTTTNSSFSLNFSALVSVALTFLISALTE